MDFVSCFSELVRSVVLLAPVGLLRRLPREYTRSAFWYPVLVSKAGMRRLVGAALGVDVRGREHPGTDTPTSGFSAAEACQFQFDMHRGHVHSFLSGLQYGPRQDQEAVWRKACRIIKGGAGAGRSRNLRDKILVICGAEDEVVPSAHVHEDLMWLLGLDHFEFATVPGGHGFVYPNGADIALRMLRFWAMETA